MNILYISLGTQEYLPGSLERFISSSLEMRSSSSPSSSIPSLCLPELAQYCKRKNWRKPDLVPWTPTLSSKERSCILLNRKGYEIFQNAVWSLVKLQKHNQTWLLGRSCRWWGRDGRWSGAAGEAASAGGAPSRHLRCPLKRINIIAKIAHCYNISERVRLFKFIT